MATIRDVANKAGVSIGSVSRVINNDNTNKMTEETKNRILNAITELNYTPSIAYSKKKSGKLIGCIQRITIEGTKDSYFATISSGIMEKLNECGETLTFSQTQFEFETTSNIESVFPKMPKGLIIMGDINPDAYQQLKAKVQYIVGVDTSYNDIDNIRYNRFQAGVMAVEHLIACGHKKIAYIGSHIQKDNLDDIGRFEAYNRVMQKYNLPIDQNWIIDCKWHRETCFEKTIELLQLENKPTAIFVASDHMAIASMAAIHSKKLNIPEDISVIGISDIDASAYLTPPLTTVSIPQKEMGEIVAETLLQRMKGDSTITKQIFVPCKLIIRNSIKNMNEKKPS